MKITYGIGCALILILAFSCVDGSEFDIASQECDKDLEANIDFTGLDALFRGETVQIHDDLVMEGFVISSDKAGNFYSSVFIQDRANDPSMGIQLELEQRESHLSFKVGSKIFINLKGLYLGKSKETLKLGGTFSSFGNISVGRLPTHKIAEHFIPACNSEEILEPVVTTLVQLDSLPLNTLIQLKDLEVVDEELGDTFAGPGEETKHTLKDCEDNRVTLLSSGFSDFQSEVLPNGNGSLTGILQKDGDDFVVVIRNLDDLDFTQERCPEIITEFTSDQFFFSELADPNNDSGARFVELYNSSEEPLDLNQWTLRRYTNDKTEVSSSIDLSGVIVEGKTTFVISPNPIDFELVYGFPPDMAVSTNSPADSNGDDNLELVDPFGTIVDRFGVIGEDGSGTNHEFEDGRAIRKSEIANGNPTYTFEEWILFNDTGESGTTKQPQNAPEDFSPGERN